MEIQNEINGFKLLNKEKLRYDKMLFENEDGQTWAFIQAEELPYGYLVKGKYLSLSEYDLDQLEDGAVIKDMLINFGKQKTLEYIFDSEPSKRATMVFDAHDYNEAYEIIVRTLLPDGAFSKLCDSYVKENIKKLKERQANHIWEKGDRCHIQGCFTLYSGLKSRTIPLDTDATVLIVGADKCFCRLDYFDGSYNQAFYISTELMAPIEINAEYFVREYKKYWQKAFDEAKKTEAKDPYKAAGEIFDMISPASGVVGYFLDSYGQGANREYAEATEAKKAMKIEVTKEEEWILSMLDKICNNEYFVSEIEWAPVNGKPLNPKLSECKFVSKKEITEQEGPFFLGEIGPMDVAKYLEKKYETPIKSLKVMIDGNTTEYWDHTLDNANNQQDNSKTYYVLQSRDVLDEYQVLLCDKQGRIIKYDTYEQAYDAMCRLYTKCVDEGNKAIIWQIQEEMA